MPYTPAPASSNITSAAPTGTTSATAVMMGIAGSITPLVTGRIFLIASGTMKNDTTADGVTIDLRYGTGSAPSNGNAVTGTLVGIAQTFTALTGSLTNAFSIQGIITGLAVPGVNSLGATGSTTAVWLDLTALKISAGTASVANVSISAFEF